MASKKEIHRLATKAKIPWDDDPKFKRWSKHLTGKDHLDEMTPDQLSKMKRAILSRMGQAKTASQQDANRTATLMSAGRTLFRPTKDSFPIPEVAREHYVSGIEDPGTRRSYDIKQSTTQGKGLPRKPKTTYQLANRRSSTGMNLKIPVEMPIQRGSAYGLVAQGRSGGKKKEGAAPIGVPLPVPKRNTLTQYITNKRRSSKAAEWNPTGAMAMASPNRPFIKNPVLDSRRVRGESARNYNKLIGPAMRRPKIRYGSMPSPRGVIANLVGASTLASAAGETARNPPKWAGLGPNPLRTTAQNPGPTASFKPVGKTRGGTYLDIMKRASVGHVEQRAKERAHVSKKEINLLRKSLLKMRLRKGMTYHYTWPGRGHAIIGDVGKSVPKHVVKTMYKPTDLPPGRKLSVKLAG